MCWRKCSKRITLLLPRGKIGQFLVLFVILLSIMSLILTRDTLKYDWKSRTRDQLYAIRNALKNNTFFSVQENKTTTPTPTITTTISSIQRHSAIRRLFDMRVKPKSHNTTQRHPHLRKLLLSSEDICKGKSVDLLIYFNSAWNNFQRRRILRETWAGKYTFHNLTVRTVFFLGKPASSRDQIKIINEAASYGDIVQGDFLDSFQNLSMKALTCLKWINDYCIHAKYIIKADDDIFVNVFKVVEDILPKFSPTNSTVACHFKPHGTSVIIRNLKSKWFVSNTVFPGQKYFPDFCTGYVAIFTTDVIPKMYEASFKAPYISVDDVYMFGLLPQYFNTLKYIDIKENCTLNNKIALIQYKHPSSPITYVVANAWEDGNMQEYWLATTSKLSPWASAQARIVQLRLHKGPATL